MAWSRPSAALAASARCRVLPPAVLLHGDRQSFRSVVKGTLACRLRKQSSWRTITLQALTVAGAPVLGPKPVGSYRRRRSGALMDGHSQRTSAATSRSSRARGRPALVVPALVRARLAGGRQQLVGVGQPLVQSDHEHAELQRLLAAAGQLDEQLPSCWMGRLSR